MASWHRFFLDFDRFWEASWEGNQSQDRPNKASKNDAKKEKQRDSKKSQYESPAPRDPPSLGSWGVPPFKAGQSSGAAGIAPLGF